jgi:E3 ubiquitin-protein ligase synoviolin
MDRLTREAIDERLRVLENVSVAIHRSMEELTRMRSVLPPLPASARASLAATVQPTTGTVDPAPEPSAYARNGAASSARPAEHGSTSHTASGSSDSGSDSLSSQSVSDAEVEVLE